MIITWMVCSQCDPRARAFTDAACSLSLVCTQLYAIVASMPMLWQNIILDGSSSAEYAEQRCKRSGSRPLRVTVLHNMGAPNDSPRCQQVLCMALEAVVSDTHRWETLQVKTCFPGTVEAISEILDDREASLLRLSLHCGPRFCPVASFPTLFRGDMRALTHLELVRVPVPWAETPLFAGLQHLSVRLAPVWPTHTQLVCIMSAATGLAVLELEEVGTVGWPQVGAPTQVPSLTMLVLSVWENLSSPGMLPWLSTFVFPNVRNLHLWFHTPTSSIHSLRALLRHAQNISIGGALETIYEDIFPFMKEVRVLDLRRATGNLVRRRWAEQPIYMKHLEELWVRPAHLARAIRVARLRKIAGFPLKRVVCEHSPEEHEGIMMRGGWVIAPDWVVKREPTGSAHTRDGFAF